VSFETPEIIDHFLHGIAVALVFSECKELLGVTEAGRQLVQAIDNLFKLGALLAESLRALRLIPDVGLLEFALDLGQAL
jgi:hypothetical protein